VNGTYPRSTALADINGDGKLDIVVGNIGNSNTNPVQLGSVAVLMGNGDGTFQIPIQYTPFNYPGWLAVGDFNGDGLPDVAVTRLQDGHSVNVIFNQREDTSGSIRTYDGTGNKPSNPHWGSVGTDLLRAAPAAYGDGISSLAGADRPGPRDISNAVSAQTDDVPNAFHLSDFIYGWGQFIDHDLDLTPTGTTEPINIPGPQGDSWFDPNGTGNQVIPVDQFERTRAGDRLWFENTFTGQELDDLEHVTLADIIKRNTSLANLQDNVFFFEANTIGGHVFLDLNHDGVREPGEPGLAGITVELRDDSGALLATVQTLADGSYSFTGLTAGTTYQVHVVLPPTYKPTTPTELTVTLADSDGAGEFNTDFGAFSA
jgi:hypothetical protein